MLAKVDMTYSCPHPNRYLEMTGIFAAAVNLPSWAMGDEFVDTANPPIAKHDIIE